MIIDQGDTENCQKSSWKNFEKPSTNHRVWWVTMSRPGRRRLLDAFSRKPRSFGGPCRINLTSSGWESTMLQSGFTKL